MHDEHETMSRRAHTEKQKRRAHRRGLPFFLALGILTVVAWKNARWRRFRSFLFLP